MVACAVMLGTCMAQASTFQVRETDAKPWIAILGSVGITQETGASPAIIVAGQNAKADAAKLADDHILILEGTGAAAAQLGFVSQNEKIAVRQISDSHAPNTQIIWDQPSELARVTPPGDYRIFAKEKWKGIPVLAGKRTAHGAVLWLAMTPGVTGYERFPYLLQALVDLGWTAPAASSTLWAFFDSSYRIRADPDYLARRWRLAGISVLHVAAWHNMEPDATQDEYLNRLIEACHRNAILVYAWLELPHVSEKFWADHPTWREKTAVGQDAQLDWRKLMNLQNPDCRKAVANSIGALLSRFDWDGVNLAELYFESLEGAANPARFTPLNDDVRAEFKNTAGFDPKLLFDNGSAYAMAAHPEALRKFLEYRSQLASRMQRDWLEVVDRSKHAKPYLDIVLTHIDDRFEPGIRDDLGADVARTLPLIEQRKNTLLVEDPATLWALGPERYARLADQYEKLTSHRDRLAVDINVVERYQDVYPTKKQTGVELLELVHQAAISFGHVALYFENSLEKQDLSLIPASAATARIEEKGPDAIDVTASEPTRIAWQGPAEIDGKSWPIQDNESILAPAGKHRLATGTAKPAVTIRDFNGEVRSAVAGKERLDIAYESQTRAIALLGTPVSTVDIDGEPFKKITQTENAASVLLPTGQHVVSFIR